MTTVSPANMCITTLTGASSTAPPPLEGEGGRGGRRREKEGEGGRSRERREKEGEGGRGGRRRERGENDTGTFTCTIVETRLSLSLYLMVTGMRLLHSLCITDVSFNSVRTGRPE